MRHGAIISAAFSSDIIISYHFMEYGKPGREDIEKGQPDRLSPLYVVV